MNINGSGGKAEAICIIVSPASGQGADHWCREWVLVAGVHGQREGEGVMAGGRKRGEGGSVWEVWCKGGWKRKEGMERGEKVQTGKRGGLEGEEEERRERRGEIVLMGRKEGKRRKKGRGVW